MTPISEETCPGCGSPVRVVEEMGTEYETVIYVCGTGEDAGYFGRDCWANQCTQAWDRIKVLEKFIRDKGQAIPEPDTK